jgi:hypothetical protein
MENFLSARQVYDGSAEIEEEPKIQCALEMICFKVLSKGWQNRTGWRRALGIEHGNVV